MNNDKFIASQWFERFWKTVVFIDTSKQWERLFIGFIFLISAWAIIPLIDTYYLYTFESDSQSTINISLSFVNALENRNIKLLAELAGYPPYFDAQFLIYAIVALLLRTLQHIHLLNLEFLPTAQSLMIFTVRYTNALLNILSSIILFKSLQLIKFSNFISLLVGLIFIFNSQIYEIDLMRIDYVILLLFLVVSYSSLALIKHPNLKRLSVALGISFALLINTKMNALMFGYIPFFSIALLFISHRYSIKNICLFLVSFLVTLLLAFCRYIINFNTVISVLTDRTNELKLWYSAISKEPYFYYNWDYFLKYGHVFLVLILISITTLIVFLYKYNKQFSIAGFLILSSLIVFSAIGMLSPKMDRWGIHFIPLYMWTITLAVTFWRYQLKNIRDAKVLKAFFYLMIVIVFLQPSLLLFKNHQLIVQRIEQRPASIKITREEPRKWFIKNAPSGTRVACYKIHTWANPPIFDLPLDFSSNILDYPYLKSEDMAVFMPPTWDALEASVDVVLLENYHKVSHIDSLTEANLTKQADVWNAFYKELDSRYKRIVFKSEYENYGINEVLIYVISPKLLNRLEQGR